jgi:hypothetical protein
MRLIAGLIDIFVCHVRGKEINRLKMRQHNLPVLLFIILTLIGGSRVYSQDKPDPFWIDAGLGYALA